VLLITRILGRSGGRKGRKALTWNSAGKKVGSCSARGALLCAFESVAAGGAGDADGRVECRVASLEACGARNPADGSRVAACSAINARSGVGP
jgi:hypothetical protein